MKIPLPVLDIVNLANQYGLVTDFSGRIMHSNSLLKEVLDFSVNWLDEVFGPGYGPVLQHIQDAIAGRIMVPFETEIDFGDGIKRIYGQVFPVQTDTEYLAMMLFHPVENLALLEGTLFERRSKLPTDSRWLLDEYYNTLKFEADPESVFYGRSPGFSLFEAVARRDYELLNNAFEKSRLSVGETISVIVDAQRAHGECRIEVDIIFGPDMYYGNRYYVMTRPAINRALGILERMAEAYQVKKDKELAARLGVVPTSISNARTSNREIPLTWIHQCWMDCKVRYRWLYGGVGDKFYKNY